MTRANEDYFEILPQVDAVDLWLSRRLPFEPRGELLEARNALRGALSRMRIRSDQLLAAQYRSPDDSLCDVENVLLYNVGAYALSHLTKRGLAFGRLREAPPQSPSGDEYAHHHRYLAMDVPTEEPESPGNLSFDISDVDLSKVHDVWWAAARSKASQVAKISGRFALHVIIESDSELPSAAALVKPLLDGIISALHSDAEPDQEAVRRLSEREAWPPDEILERLRHPATPILGERRTLRPYRSFVKWDPADDLCDRCVLLIRRSAVPRCTVQIQALTP